MDGTNVSRCDDADHDCRAFSFVYWHVSLQVLRVAERCRDASNGLGGNWLLFFHSLRLQLNSVLTDPGTLYGQLRTSDVIMDERQQDDSACSRTIGESIVFGVGIECSDFLLFVRVDACSSSNLQAISNANISILLLRNVRNSCNRCRVKHAIEPLARMLQSKKKF